ncbi:hypothetical protein CORC01_04892 [Colletotrichum orchidophilum]|uniref:Rad21/Rec8-like protein N-terminal domain-containing protein n=1 Tax=Colletotrichum orchidophilum TaxID=1209926 RepID=A0A1G4BEK0_9PEZI|nr:uncharacterized protein CORC01_04892 [Colletotrichum orchidophilum]OHE99756.1 hypothetical protein CORC01_04892 [Colletotrichum orchidophilum]
MFYSHEILTSHQFGVATIWVVATIGPRGGGTQKKVSRRAIEDVDIRKACEKIIQPGAPISLRLQSNLLYGVSRVYSSQCKYMLTDTEKIQTTMKTFLRLIANNETDPKAGRARREQITLGDDPGFFPTSIMPFFTIDEDGNPCFVPRSQHSSGCKPNKSQSQLSPFPDPVDFLDDSGHGNSPFHLDFSQSPEVPDFRLPSPFAQRSAQKTLLPRSRDDMELDMNVNPFGALDDFDNFGGVELAIDENGAVILDEDELELPELAGIDMDMADVPLQQDQVVDEDQDAVNVLNTDALAAIPVGSDPLPLLSDAPLAPEPPLGVQSDQAAATSKRRRRILKLDNGTQISRLVLKSWQEDYLQNEERAIKKRKSNASQAKKNAYFFTLGMGIGGVGIYGADFPLAEMFAGDGLRDVIYGPPAEGELNVQTPSSKGRRRRADEAFGEGSGGHRERNVRPRVNETPQQGRSMDDNTGFDMAFGDDSLPEMGMEAGQPMNENPSSSMMPWAHTPSAGRGSSVASHSAQRHEHGSRRKSASIRGSSMLPFEPLHDAQHTSDFDAIPFDISLSQGLAPESPHPAGILIDAQEEGGDDSQWMRSMLDSASGEFLQWTEEEAKKMGQIKEGDPKKGRRWVEFEELIEPTKQNHIVAAQAFYHILSLATKDAIAVEQHVAGLQPFGRIRIGVDMTAHFNNSEEE